MVRSSTSMTSFSLSSTTSSTEHFPTPGQSPCGFEYYNDGKSLLVPDDLDEFLDENWQNFPKERFKTIRIPSQINQQCRALVHQKFTRHPMVRVGGYTSPVPDAWVMPDTDIFILNFFIERPDLRLTHSIINESAAMVLAHSADDLLENIRKVQLNEPFWLSEGNPLSMRAPRAIPKLTEITVVFGIFGTHNIKDDLTSFSAGIIDIPEVLVELVNFRDRHGNKFEAFWRQFRYKGVRLLGKLNPSSGVVLEVLSTPEGACMQWLPHVLEDYPSADSP